MLQRYLPKGLCLLLLAILPAFAFAQLKVNYSIKGTVTDDGGEPLIGVSVFIDELREGTVTDLYGFYEINGTANEGNYTLTLSYVGYQRQNIAISFAEGKTTFVQDVKLFEDVLSLDEVVVTGNSPTSTRKQLGNAIGVVGGEKLEATGSTNILGALSGKVMGAQISQNSGDPSGGFSIRLRGPSSILGSSDPLYIVDGVIVDNSSRNVINLSADAMTTNFLGGTNRVADLNPNDIARVEVLSGASAAAIYGSRAANGVVQIFTKKGKTGKPKVEFSTSASYSQLRQKVFFTEYGKRFGVKGNDRLETTQDRLTVLLHLGPTEAQLVAAGVNFIKTDPGNRLLVTDQYDVTRYDYQEEIFAPAMGTDNFISVTGGTDKSSYYGSFGYSFNEGIVKNTNAEKYTGRLRFDQTINSWLTASAGIAYNYTKSKDMPNGNNFFSPVSTMYIIDNVWDITERDALGNLKQVELVRVNPLSVLETFDLRQRVNRTMGDLQLKFFPVKGLQANFIIGFDSYSLLGNEYHPRLPYAGVAATFFPDGYVSVANSNVNLLNNDFNVSYFANLTEKFTSNTTAGYQIQYEKTNFQAQEGRDLAPFVQTISAASNLFNLPGQQISERLVNGYFLQETFGYDDQIFLTLAGRVDGSSAFSDDNQFNFFPKASISWILSEMLGLENTSMGLNTAKIRASYGEAGNLTGIGAYDRYDNFNLSSIGGLAAITPSSILANPDVKPERMTEFEVGTDLALVKNRLGFSFTYYNQEINDLLLARLLPPSAGGTTIVTNVGGSMKNRGIEFLLNLDAVKSKNFNWSIGFNFSSNRNEVSGIDGILALRGSDGAQSALNGEQYGVFFGRYYARDANGGLLLTQSGLAQPERGFVIAASKYNESALPSAAQTDRIYQYGGSYFIPARDANGQPLRTAVTNDAGQSFSPEELRKVIGDPNPEWIGSLSSSLNYKKLSFGFQLDAFMGADIYNWNRITSNNVGFGEIAEQELKGEVARGYVGSIAGGVTGQRIMEEHVEDASYIKIRELSLAYNFGKVGGVFENLGLSLIGRNLVSFDSYLGFDPEVNSAGQTDRVRGDDFGAIPIPMSIQLRLNAGF